MNIEGQTVEADVSDETGDLMAELKESEGNVATDVREAIDVPLHSEQVMREAMNAVAVMDKPVEVPQKKAVQKEKTERNATVSDITHFDSYVLTHSQKKYLVFKRVADFVISLISLIIFAIPFVIIAVVQKSVAPKEPVFFRQTRIGRNGQPFKVTKFRSMKSTAPHDCPTKDFNECGQYVTKWGRFLRDTSIDELPQLFQVISGKMSLIGPRPLIPQEESVHRMREQAGVYQLRPGMTGWAQVNGRDLVSDENKVKLDCEYLQKIGLKVDFMVLFLTVKKVLKGTDIEEGRASALNKESECGRSDGKIPAVQEGTKQN